MHDATKRFEIETLLKAGLPKARVAEIAGVSVRGGPGRPSKTGDYRELVASILEAQPGLQTLEVLRRARLADYGGSKTALCALVRELRPRAVHPICRLESVAGEFSQAGYGPADAWRR